MAHVQIAVFVKLPALGPFWGHGATGGVQSDKFLCCFRCAGVSGEPALSGSGTDLANFRNGYCAESIVFEVVIFRHLHNSNPNLDDISAGKVSARGGLANKMPIFIRIFFYKAAGFGG